jgi:SAM-dependent methyltransferase
MEGGQETPVEDITEQLRQHWQASTPVETTSSLADSPVRADLTALHNSYDVCHMYFTSHRKVFGRFVVAAKQVLRKLLTPILERQLAYNAANTRVVSYLYEQRMPPTEVTKRFEEIRQQQTATAEMLRDIVVEQVEAFGQQQVATMQSLRDMVAEQIAILRQQQATALQKLHQAEHSALDRMDRTLAEGETRLREVERLHQVESSALGRMDRTLAEGETRLREVERLSLRLRTDLQREVRRIDLLLEEARKRLPEPFNQDQLLHLAEEARHTFDALYLSFEDQFRGSREDIKERLHVYLPILKDANLGADGRPILDLGCGRGEWLELLQEQGLQARGVDCNRVLVAECRQRGLEVVEGDALTYLRTLPDASVGAVTGFHLIEHLPFDAMIFLLDEAVRILKTGGVAIFETPNPENVRVGSYTFYLDPTHRNPLPSAVIKFVAEARGFCGVEIKTLHPCAAACRVEEAGLEVAKRFNEYFYGPQDYAIIGWKV